MFLAACMTAEGKKGSVRLESSYDITLVRGDDGGDIYVAEIETYIVNDSSLPARFLSFSGTVEIRDSNGNYVFSAGLGRRKDGRIIRSPEGAFNPVTLRSGEIARLPLIKVKLSQDRKDLVNFHVYYKIDSDFGELQNCWVGELDCIPIRRSQAGGQPSDLK
jgi:hypothetical protein